MPYCSNCGLQVGETDRFCSRCGNQLKLNQAFSVIHLNESNKIDSFKELKEDKSQSSDINSLTNEEDLSINNKDLIKETKIDNRIYDALVVTSCINFITFIISAISPSLSVFGFMGMGLWIINLLVVLFLNKQISFQEYNKYIREGYEKSKLEKNIFNQLVFTLIIPIMGIDTIATLFILFGYISR